MDPGPIRPAQRADLAALDAALAQLSRDVGDPHRSGVEALDRALFGTPPAALALVSDGTARLAGVVLFAPVFSTVRGGAGLYVSDLWVDGAARGSGLGAALLCAAARMAATDWGAMFMRLAVHDHNARGQGFYRTLGFDPVEGETVMVLTGEAFQQIRRTT